MPPQIPGPDRSSSRPAALKNDLSQSKKVQENEQLIDYLAGAIGEYLVNINLLELTEQESKYITRVYQTLNDLERIGDYAVTFSLFFIFLAGCRKKRSCLCSRPPFWLSLRAFFP